MKVCNYCGVELDADMNYCPLCGHKSNSTLAGKTKVSGKKDSCVTSNESVDFEQLTIRQKQKVVWELGTLILTLTSVVTLIIDLVVAGHITWSKYTLTIGAVLLMDLTLIAFLHKRILLMFAGCFVSTAFLLLMLDVFNNKLDLGIKLGIPILFFIFLVLFFLSLAIKQTKQKGINIIAYCLMAAGVICLCIEGIISIHLHGTLDFYWSILVLLSVMPVSAILLYIHYRLKKATNLRKTFHV